MDAIISFLESIGNFISTIFDFFTNIIKYIGEVISLPAQALETLSDFASFIPDVFWVPLSVILGIVVVFRLLKIFQSGG